MNSDRLQTLYPGYNVLDEQAHWDDHTREIVLKRLETPGSFKQLSGQEAERIRAMAALFVDDARTALLDFVVKHFDNLLASDIGESQRKASTPGQKELIKQGLAAIERLAQETFDRAFTALTPEQQTSMLVELENDMVTLQTAKGQTLPAREFFKKMLSETVNAYYSHPLVWSEIGYGGPAYPRGYVRSEFGLTDPWEAKRDAKH